jgi:hypothetical protein
MYCMRVHAQNTIQKRSKLRGMDPPANQELSEGEKQC